MNTDPIVAKFLERLINLETERRSNAEVSAEYRKELVAEMKAKGLTRVAIDAVKLKAKRHFEDPDKREHRLSVEEFAESLGDIADTPLGRAAVAVHVAGERIAV